jgi:hypothetical protein
MELVCGRPGSTQALAESAAGKLPGICDLSRDMEYDGDLRTGDRGEARGDGVEAFLEVGQVKASDVEDGQAAVPDAVPVFVVHEAANGDLIERQQTMVDIFVEARAED